MIKEIKSFLNKDELELAKEYWLIKEPNLNDCSQCPNSVAIYNDILSETFLKTKQYLIEELIKEKLLPTYSYSRMYYKGGLLKKHSDRPSCEISVTLNIFADKEWKIFFRALKKNSLEENPKAKINSFVTNSGDGIIYEGCNYSHWREEYKGEKCMQVFLHYVRPNGKYKNFIFDGRNRLGQDKQKLW